MLQIIERLEPNWLFILPVCKLLLTHIHWRGDKLAGVKDTNYFKAEVLYKSFVEHPNKFKQVENWLLIIKLFVEFIKVYLPVIVLYVTVVLGKFELKYEANWFAL